MLGAAWYNERLALTDKWRLLSTLIDQTFCDNSNRFESLFYVLGYIYRLHGTTLSNQLLS